jgi:OOP family OmpA-OmpF porin
LQRLEAHATYLNSVADELGLALSAAAAAHGDRTTWPQMVQGPPKPHACLKCAMPDPTAFDPRFRDGLEVSFEAGSSALSKEAEATLEKIEARLRGETGKTAIRGHADPGEPGDLAKLSRARADAVRAWLVKKGVPASSLTTTGYGGDLPIGSVRDEAGRARNRRVDFATTQKK